nr:MAG TPA: hypothetical protein [Caudoviricetes sp.]
MVMAKLHTICGNCGCLIEDQTLELSYDPEEDQYDVYLQCPNCTTLHFFDVEVDEDKSNT